MKEVKAVRNFPIQGTQADMIKLAIHNIKQLRRDGLDAMLKLQVHDELVYQVPERFDGVSDLWQINKNEAFEFRVNYDRRESFDNAIRFCDIYAEKGHVVDIKKSGLSLDYKISNSLAIPVMMLYSADLYLERFTMSSSLEVRKWWQK